MITKTKTNHHLDLEDVKKHLRLDSDFTDDNNYVSTLIESAVSIAENYIEADIAITTNVLVLKDFSSTTFTVGEGNLISITSIEDSEATVYTVDELRTFKDRFEVELTAGVPDKDLTVTFTTGYAAGTLPAALWQALMIKVADLYDNQRSGFTFVSTKYNPVFESLLNYYKTPRFKNYPSE